MRNNTYMCVLWLFYDMLYIPEGVHSFTHTHSLAYAYQQQLSRVMSLKKVCLVTQFSL